CGRGEAWAAAGRATSAKEAAALRWRKRLDQGRLRCLEEVLSVVGLLVGWQLSTWSERRPTSGHADLSL
ncbi:MAG TPA: hypothetical protein VMS00_16140, partial [Acidimicrobiales bacterium]|nr:hypothetical protein [Acidimicrobiales bacterium]